MSISLMMTIVVGGTVALIDSFTITADSPGIEGNNTQVVITNDIRDAVSALMYFPMVYQ